MSDRDRPDPKRREFLHTAKGAGLLGAALALLSRAAPLAAAEAASAAPEEAAPDTSGYHETEHIRKYYDTLRRF
jgi:hypothetical protein